MQELLDKLLEKELERLRKIFFPYKRRKLLTNKIDISIGECNEKSIGYYENSKRNINDVRYTHHIYITSRQVNSYNTYCKYNHKKFAIRELRGVIVHELIHAFVFEEFEEWEELANCNCDYSPIFLSCLFWVGGNSNHNFVNKFRETALWKEISSYTTYESVYKRLIIYTMEFKKVLNKINSSLSDNNNANELSIIFSDNPGITKNIDLKVKIVSKVENKLIYKSIKLLTLGVGFLVTPTALLNNYKKSFNNDIIAKNYKETKLYAIGDKTIRESIIFSNIK